LSDQGVFAVHRGIWDHPMFAPESFTEREAWIWLVGTAVWKPSRVRAGRKLIDLARGQLIFSERFLAEKWGWSKTSVRRFLDRLKSESMIDTLADRDATLITICNYEKYAFDGTARGPRNGPRTGPLEDHSRTKEEETNNLIIDKIAEPRASNFTEASKALASSLWKALGHESALSIPPELAGADWRAIEWERAGWTVDLIDTEARRIGPGKPISYYEKCFATSFAKRQAPLPVVEIREADKLTVTHGTNQIRSVSAVAKRWAEQFESQSGDDSAGNPVPILRIPAR
jgi:hypothetical protein